jgi:hypothetical protein
MAVKTPIPRTLRVGAKKYSIDVVEAMLEKSRMGNINYDARKIKVGLKSNITGKPFNEVTVMETFWHELIHAILEDMERHTLNSDEKFVKGFAQRLQQAIKSSRF